jgi:hypothetical protein
VSAQAEAGNVKIVRGLWNDEFLRELENFPAGKHDDCVDALSGAYEQIGGRGGPFEYESISRPGNGLRGISQALGGREHWAPRQGLWY